MKILLLEDDYSLNKAITNYLRTQGFFVDNFYSGDDALKKISYAQYDLCILDINVPHIDGQHVLKHLRSEQNKIPVIVMSAMKDMDTIKRSYDFGCDDYLKKPFEIEELMLRVNYLLKYSSLDTTNIVTLKHGFTFDNNTMTLSNNDIQIDLSSKEQLMLSLFVKNIGATVTIAMFQEYVWNGEEVESVSIRSMIHKLKSKLKSGMIVNLRGVGYKLLA